MTKPRLKLMAKRVAELSPALASDLVELLHVEREKWRPDEQAAFAVLFYRSLWINLTMACVAMDAPIDQMLDDFQRAVRHQEQVSRDYADQNRIIV